MNKKNNRSGFTLVELIVVMCLMGIIMGAVLNFIQPTAKLYKTTNTYLNEEEAVTTIANALEDDLMYATGVYVYATDDETKGPAEIENIITEIFNDKGINIKEQNKSMSNCIVLDNVNVRDTPVAISKGSKGRILKYGYNGARFEDVSASGMMAGEKLYNNAFALQDQTFMGDDQFTFSIENSAASQNSMNIRMNVYRPSYNGADYEYNELTFSAVKAIEFLNIKAGNVTVDYSNVNNAAAVTDPKYIYIFYNRKQRVNANATRYPYQCYVKDANGDYCDEAIYTSEYYEGDDISENVRDNAESSNIEMYIKDGYVYQRTGLYATVPDITEETNVNVVDLTCMPAASSNPLKLYAVYKKTHESAMPALTVRFWEDKGMTIKKAEYTVQFNSAVPSVPGLHYEENPLLSFTSGERRSYERWADCTSDEPVSSFEHITRDLDVYKQTYYYDAVTFVDEAGEEIPNDDVKDSEGNVLGNNIPVIEGGTLTTEPSLLNCGLLLDVASYDYQWVYVGGTHDGEIFSTSNIVDGPQLVQVKATPKPPPPPGPAEATSVLPSGTSTNGNQLYPTVTISNTASQDIVVNGKLTIKISFDMPVTLSGQPYFVDWRAQTTCSLSADKKTLIITIENDPSNDALEISAGADWAPFAGLAVTAESGDTPPSIIPPISVEYVDAEFKS